MTAVITGATKGIGLAITEGFAAIGYDIIACARSGKTLQELAAGLLSRYPGIQVKYRVTDVGNATQVKEFGAWITSNFGAPDVLVNNAGYFIPGTIHEEKDGILEKMVAVNLCGAYHLTRSLLPFMQAAKKGDIFNICSAASVKPMNNVGAYGISKFALLGFTRHLREEMKPFGIRVTAVIPGSTYTSSWFGEDVNPRRLADPADIARLVVAAAQLSPLSVVEDIVIRPQAGDL